MLLFFVGELFASRSAASPEGTPMTVLLGAFHLPVFGYVAIFAVCLALAAMAAVFSRVVAAAHLRALS